jgi:hypothetical protein|nr:MAG TPA: hypothetical protein [Caudoviricetes sp.]
MSLYTKQEKVKSLWYPITDEDFEIDFSKPFIVCCVDTSLFIVKDFADMFNYLDEDRFYDVKTQALTEEGKEEFREDYFGYMYLDDEFYQAIECEKGKYLEDVKGNIERPDLFVMTKTGPRIFTRSDFEPDGSPLICFTSNLSKDFAQKYPELYDVEYIVNLNHVPATSINALFLVPLDEPKTAYVVTSGQYSDYHVDGVFSDKQKANSFANKAYDRAIERYNIDDEEQLREENWYGIDVFISKSSKVKSVLVNDLCKSDKYFDAVSFTLREGADDCFSFYLKALNRDKAKAIALERFHALLAVESSHFPMLRWTRVRTPYCSSDGFQEGLVFGYFDYKAYFYPCDRNEKTQDLFMKIKDYLPTPLTEEDENNIDWQNLTEETCLQLMRSHGLDIELKKDLSYVFYD